MRGPLLGYSGHLKQHVMLTSAHQVSPVSLKWGRSGPEHCGPGSLRGRCHLRMPRAPQMGRRGEAILQPGRQALWSREHQISVCPSEPGFLIRWVGAITV